MSADSGSGVSAHPGTLPSERLKGRDWPSSKGHHSKKASDKVIVRLVTKNRMVTKGYQEGVYERVTLEPAQKSIDLLGVGCG